MTEAKIFKGCVYASIGDGATATKYAVKYGDDVVAAASKAGDDLVGATCSFTAETPVLTDEGLVAIGELVEGDSVLAFINYMRRNIMRDLNELNMNVGTTIIVGQMPRERSFRLHVMEAAIYFV